MLDRYCELSDKTIINVFIADEDFVAEYKPEAILCPDGFGVGDKCVDGKFERSVVVVKNDLEA